MMRLPPFTYLVSRRLDETVRLPGEQQVQMCEQP
jgi:hypothetical protein